ncbi:MAG: DUF5053 domain-containing protein [Prevotella sp.]|jgi:hypothetical protein|nr:DUF5053 domain-containing protein [Prevotella sp.]
MKKNIIEEELELLRACKTDEERQLLVQQLKTKHKNDSDDDVMKSLSIIKDKVEDISFEVSLLELSNNGISLTYLAEKYLGKSRSYLSQRLNRNKVNGKAAKLTNEEKIQLKFGLEDMSKKLLNISISL